MSRLNEIRDEIDKVNREVLDLLVRRIELLDKIRQLKAVENLALHDPEREAAMIKQAEGQLRGKPGAEFVMHAFRGILKASLGYLQSRPK